MKRILYFGATALALLFTNCSDDLVQENGGSKPAEYDQTLYVNMSISGDNVSGSRAAGDNGAPGTDDFEDGTDAGENLVNNAYFVFYDEDGEVVGDIVSIDMATFKESTNLNNDVIEKTYSSVVPVSVKKGEKKPTQVICYLNPIQPSTLNTSLNNIQTVVRPSTYSIQGKDKYFAMSNSVYFPDETVDEDSLYKQKPLIAVPIKENQLYTSEEGARQALGTENTVNIYVERYAAKLKFQAKEADTYYTGTRYYPVGSSEYTSNLVELDFHPLYWAVNAESKSTFVIKSFNGESDETTVLGAPYTYGMLNERININNINGALGSTNLLSKTDMWDWNNPDYHRSYWGMSPAYFQPAYPEVSSDLKDSHAGELQKYISFTELLDGDYGFEVKVDASGKPLPSNYEYFRETTVGRNALRSANPLAAVASVIYVGKSTLKVKGVEVPEGTSFYSYLPGPVPGMQNVDQHPYIYFDASGGNPDVCEVDGGGTMLKRFFAQATILYKAIDWDKDGNAISFARLSLDDEEDMNMMTTALMIDTISDALKTAYDGNAQTKLKTKNSTRTLQFKGVDEAADIYIVSNNGYNKIVSDEVTPGNNEVTLTQANVALARQVGWCYYYTIGHGYYNIPVKHLGWYRKGNTQKDADKINWNLVRVGDFGMVRNHSYFINVTQITGLPEPIADDDNPIVPPSTTEDYFMAYSVNILKWAVVPQQNVKL